MTVLFVSSDDTAGTCESFEMSSLVLFGQNSSAVVKRVSSQLTLLDSLTGLSPLRGSLLGPGKEGRFCPRQVVRVMRVMQERAARGRARTGGPGLDCCRQHALGRIHLVLHSLARMILPCHPHHSSPHSPWLSNALPAVLTEGSWLAERRQSDFPRARPRSDLRLPVGARPALRLLDAPRSLCTGHDLVGGAGPTHSAVIPVSARPGRTRSRAVAGAGALGRRMFTAVEVGAAQAGGGRASGARGAAGRGPAEPGGRAAAAAAALGPSLLSTCARSLARAPAPGPGVSPPPPSPSRVPGASASSQPRGPAAP